jgi:tyrosinase
MRHLSRRYFLHIAASTPLALWASRFARASASPVTRVEARTPEGIAMLEKYAKAVAIMKDTTGMPVGKPLSWQFQWFTHWTPSDKAALISQIYPQGTPPEWKAVADKAWATCQAHFQAPPREKFFLPWHRWYLYFFEAIIRELLKDQTFALPYWDYTKNPVLPDQFRMPNHPQFKSLFDDTRDKDVNNGGEIYPALALQKLMHDALCQTRYIGTSRLNPGFCDHLDGNLHGAVHGLIGGDMGIVPTAGNDPIFWLHHCNIDRLWASWINSGGKNLSESGFKNEPFTFAGSDAKAVTKTAGDALDPAGLGYQYDRLEQRAADCPPFAGPEAATPPTVVLKAAAAVTLGNESKRVPLKPVATPEAAHAKGTHSWLILSGVSVTKSPDEVYEVYLNLPEKASKEQLEAYRIGVISFFDLVPQEGHPGRKDKAFSFDVTGVLKGGNAQVSVTVAPRNSVDSSVQVTVGNIEIVRR